MSRSKAIAIAVTGNTAPLRKSLTNAEKQLVRFADQSRDQMKRSAASFGIATAAVGALATKFYLGAQEAEKANRRVAAVAESMGIFGQATDYVTNRLTSYADALERETGFTAESIKETQAKLLTFRELAKSADETGGAFDRATVAAVDLAATGFGDATTNAVQLGKALQDPIKGITALARSGVTFTNTEKEKIRTLVESGELLEAQNIILTAIETQVGGTAEATATATQKMINSFGEVTDVVGDSLAPAFEGAAGAAQQFAQWAQRNQAVVAGATIALGGLVIAIAATKAAMATATAVSAAYAAAQAAVASANLAVQASTIVGIATATAAATAIAILTTKVYNSVKAHQAAADAIKDHSDALTVFNQLELWYADLRAEMDRIAAEQAERRAKAEAAAAERTKKQADAYKALKQRITDAKDAIRDYVGQIRDQINAEVSLSSAFSEAQSQQKDAAAGVNDALAERRDAYEALNEAKAAKDRKAFADATARVAAAEAAVTEAEAVKPKDYRTIFAEQIAAAKAFAGYVKQLAAAGLGKAGLAQILDLGPVAGAQVAKDLLSGTGGMTVSSLNADLADIASAGTAAGMAIPGFEAALGATVGGTAAAPTIVINAGVGDPVAIGKEVAAVLNAYGAKTGGIPVAVKQPKAKATTKPPKKSKTR